MRELVIAGRSILAQKKIRTKRGNNFKKYEVPTKKGDNPFEVTPMLCFCNLGEMGFFVVPKCVLRFPCLTFCDQKSNGPQRIALGGCFSLWRLEADPEQVSLWG